MNKFLILFLAIALIGAIFLGSKSLTDLPRPEPAAETPTTGTQVCAQVITPARNPLTGEIKEYPTPCDVPPTWEVIVNEVPGL